MFVRLLAPLGVFAVLALATVLRFWALGQPATLVFDELYYVRDAISQLAHGFPTNWPDDDPLMGAAFTDEGSYAVHPPLGKWMIALGLVLFGDETGWGWRSALAFFGVATVGVTMRLAWWISRSIVVSLFAGLLLAIDGVHVVLTRVALLDGFLAFFIVLGALFMWRDHEWVVSRSRLRPGRVMWNRPWLIAAAAAFGCATSVKWSGLYPLATFLLLTAARDVWVRLSVSRALRAASQPIGAVASAASQTKSAAASAATKPWGRALMQAIATGLLTIPVALAVYVASWAGWIFTSGGWGRDDGPWPIALGKYHVSMFEWHSTLSAPHPFQAHPLTWPLGLRPTAMYETTVGEGFTAVISPLPNLLVTWGGVAALLILAWWIARPLIRPHLVPESLPFPGERPRSLSPAVTQIPFAAAFVATGYLSGWLPWVLTLSRSAVFQFYAVVLTPFSAIALGLVLGAVWNAVDPNERLGRRLSVVIFLGAAVVLAVLFFPIWSGMPVPDWFWQWHRWLPGWD